MNSSPSQLEFHHISITTMDHFDSIFIRRRSDSAAATLRGAAASANKSRLLLPIVVVAASSPRPRRCHGNLALLEANDSFSASSGVTSSVIERASCGFPSFCSVLCATDKDSLILQHNFRNFGIRVCRPCGVVVKMISTRSSGQ